MHFTSVELNARSSRAPIAEFVILVASYNNEKYCEANLASLAFQESSKPYRIIIVNDCSTDKTGELLEQFVDNHQLQSKVTLIHNTIRRYSLENIYWAIHNHIEDHKIVVSVDGDDQLSSNKVLLRLEQEYKNPHIHLTYGSYDSSTGSGTHYASRMPNNIIRKGLVRQLRTFKASHLKTFRAGLF
ncbi:MAG: glycosyltransferase family 2 protein, partial [Nitrosopumilus sp.]|nr:glycosyltransferase family 2 protein [Nitrosopumilus sp.]